jgi:hypothetical protein
VSTGDKEIGVGCGCILAAVALLIAIGPILQIIEAIGKHWLK